jgi:serine/threonine protein kinase
LLKQRYQLGVRLGAGAVFAARDLGAAAAGRPTDAVAVKLFNCDTHAYPEGCAALKREADRARALTHPNIVAVTEFDHDREQPFLIMELLEGQDLGELLTQHPTGLPPRLAASVIAAMSSAVAHAHAVGVVHAGLKPANVHMGRDGRIKVLDFGLARAVAGRARGIGFDAPQPNVLTPAYASPERLAGAAPDARDDLFALGLLAVQVLTGRHPFGGLPADVAARRGFSATRPRGVTERQWQRLTDCLAFDAASRSRTALPLQEAFAVFGPLRAVSNRLELRRLQSACTATSAI